jgi:hypothetical protein
MMCPILPVDRPAGSLSKCRVNRLIISLLAWEIFLSGGVLHAAPLETGGSIPKISARDQHGADYVFTNGTAFLLIALDMESAKAANKKLAEQGAGFLEKHGAVYLMDIHAMPGIARYFALPKMRKYPHRIVLMETADALNWVPAKAGHITILKLTPEGRIKTVSYWQPAAEPAADLFN